MAKELCRYCNGNGWFYSDPEFGPCNCVAVAITPESDKPTPRADCRNPKALAIALTAYLALLIIVVALAGCAKHQPSGAGLYKIEGL